MAAIGVKPELHPRRGYRPKTFWSGGSERLCGICGSVAPSSAHFKLCIPSGIKGFLLAPARRRFHKRKEGTCLSEPQEYANQLAKLPDRIAAVVGKTYA